MNLALKRQLTLAVSFLLLALLTIGSVAPTQHLASKPTVGFTLDIQPLTAVADRAGSHSAELIIHSETDIPQLTIDVTGAQLDAATFELTNIAADTVERVPLSFALADGQGVLRAVATTDAGALRADVLHYLAAESAVYFSQAGSLDVRVMQVENEMADLDAAQLQQELDAVLGAGATADSSVRAGSGARADITIQGRVLWTDSMANTHAVREATVEIRDAEAAGSELVTTVMTDANGDFSATVNNDDGAGENGRDIFIRVIAKNSDVAVKPVGAAATPHRIDSPVTADVADNATVTVNLTANKTDDNNTAFSVFDALVVLLDYVPKVNGSNFAAIDVIFPTDQVTSLYDGTNLHVLQLDRWDWDVVHHEYGHYVMDELNIEDNPGGSHDLDENLAETRGKSNGIKLAWGEAWPTYFGTVLQTVEETAALNIPNVGDTKYTDTEDAAIDYSLESQAGVSSRGEDNEVSVSRVLWDIHDTANDDGDDGVADGHRVIWTKLDAADVETMSEAYAALVDGKTARSEAKVGCIAAEHKVAPGLTAPADKSIAPTAPPTFEWDANGGGPSNLHDKFTVEFYEDSFQTKIFTSAEQSATTFTPTQAEWDQIVMDAGVVIHWLVKGTQSNAPETGPYSSCFHRMIVPKLDLVFAIDATGSMADDIAQVEAAAIEIVDAVAASGADFQIAIVTYKDHPIFPYGEPTDYPSRIDLNFSTDAAVIKAAISAIVVDGGSDIPEAVYSGAMEAIGLPWREDSQKSVIIMGDAPPHDPEPVTGFTAASVIAAANNIEVDPIPRELRGVDVAVFYPIVVGSNSAAAAAFQQLAAGTGGQVFDAASASDVVEAILNAIDTILTSPIANVGDRYLAHVGEEITFDASNSFDPDDALVKYEWDFDDDGTYDRETTEPMTTYTYPGLYDGLVRMRVTDTDDLTSIDTAVVIVSDPTDVVLSSADGSIAPTHLIQVTTALAIIAFAGGLYVRRRRDIA